LLEAHIFFPFVFFLGIALTLPCRSLSLILHLLHSTYCHFSEDGTFYFDEKYVGGHEQRGSLSTTSSVVRGVTAFAAVTSGKINVCGV